MNQNQRQIIIAIVLGIILVGVLFYQFVLNKPRPATPTPTAKRSQQQSSKASASGTLTERKINVGEIKPSIETLEENVDEVIENLLTAIQIVQFNYQEIVPPRNPMTPLVGIEETSMFETETPIPHTEVTPGQVIAKRISAIIWDDYQPLAIIDDKLVSEGYTFPDRIQVYKIDKNRIIFKIEDALFPVRLKEKGE